jgi:glutamate N-acetyltransferase/amino-acid N-acetyltransferase
MTPGPGVARTILPKGFLASGVNCGVRRYRPDLGIILSDPAAVAAGVFTTNQAAAAPVQYCRSVLPSESIYALITNSGQANAATGVEGERANREMAFEVAKEVGCLPREVLTASTGVIGPQLDLEKILPAIGHMVNRADETAESFALAILTTDLVPKTVTTTVELSGGRVRITGICKGSGMIHPNMATMLGYLLTDAELTPSKAQHFVKEASDVSFNMISVDGDTSTNDAVFLLANGASGVAVNSEDDQLKFRAALCEIAIFLAQSIATDGEGASKLVEVHVGGAPDLSIARRAARGVTVSPLVKTALHGEDPNWGRIVARLGAEQVSGDSISKMSLSIQDVLLFKEGQPVRFDRDHVRTLLRRHKIKINIELSSGVAEATAWGCDLSKKYVDINTEYAT